MGRRLTIGCVVQYTDPDVGARPAMITRVGIGTVDQVNLVVTFDCDDPTEQRATPERRAVPYSAGGEPGTWSWLPRV